METIFKLGGPQYLKGKRIVTLFYEPSTRTRMSFEMAASYLGGVVAFSSDNAGEFSSAKKGETFEDTIRVINCYRPHVIVIRYNHEIGAELAARVSRAPIINAGDRVPGQHPTQSLLDLLTLQKRFGKIDGLKIAMVGDLKNGRTVRSLSYLLGKFNDVKIHFISPSSTRMGEDVKEYLGRHGVWVSESTDLREVAGQVDVVYQTRTQTECGASLDRSDRSLGYFTVDGNVADSMQDHAIIMHPLPRIDEITPDVDANHRSVYLTAQVESGLITRMALLKMILE
jgi:aspartate carbamoyltransferase catalytic subunit